MTEGRETAEQETRATILVVEHNMRVIMGLCDRITAINFGRKIAEGTPDHVREHKEVIEAYLGTEDETTV